VAAQAKRRLRPQGLQALWHRQQPGGRPGKPQHDCTKGINVSVIFFFKLTLFYFWLCFSGFVELL